MKIKIMNYNIRHGFHTLNFPFKLEKERLKKAKKIIKKEDADILILTEACYSEKNIFKILIDYKKIFGYKYAHFGKWGKYEWGTLILLRYPIKAKTIKLSKRTAIKSEIKIKNKTLYIDVIHPSPKLTEEQKIENIKPVLKNIKSPYILTGDFNSLSDDDKYNKRKLIEGFKTFEKDPEKVVNELLKTNFIKYLKKQGLIDAFPKKDKKPTVPTKKYKTGNTDIRIDYFFIKKDEKKMKIVETKTIKNKFAEEASDHYPILITIQI